jgi:hypothetical protein
MIDEGNKKSPWLYYMGDYEEGWEKLTSFYAVIPGFTIGSTLAACTA